MESSGICRSIWMATEELQSTGPLVEDASADVCIVGAGIAGLTTAYTLAKAGAKVVVLEDGPIGGGETGRTTAHLTNAFDDRYHALERKHGADIARRVAQSHTAAINRMEQIVRLEGIDCQFSRLDGYLVLNESDNREELDRELAAAQRAGLSDVTLVERAPFAWFDTGPCIRFPQQGQLHAVRYLNGLSAAVQRAGGRICTATHATEIDDSTGLKLGTSAGPTVSAKSIVFATNVPVNTRVTMHTKQAPYRTFVVALAMPAGFRMSALCWETGWPYHYIRAQPGDGPNDSDVLIVGGEDHKTGQVNDGEQRWARLERWTRQRFPMAGERLAHWSGQVIETMDGLGFIGRSPGDNPNIYMATGDSGMGTTHGTIAGMLLTDLILGRDNPWADVYDPSRRPLIEAGNFIRENANVAAQYADWVTPGDVKNVEDIPPNSGAVVRRGSRKLAVYRDATGRAHECSAKCVHLGCVVRWNSAEQTWDCPCHGSRFDSRGHVVNGPANSDLDTSAVLTGPQSSEEEREGRRAEHVRR